MSGCFNIALFSSGCRNCLHTPSKVALPASVIAEHDGRVAGLLCVGQAVEQVCTVVAKPSELLLHINLSSNLS